MLNEKRYVCLCIGIVAFVMSCIAGFNCWQDPADIFVGERRYMPMTKELHAGKSLVVASNYNERLFRKCVIATGSNDYAVVVLGSSRIMTIGEDCLPNAGRLINLGVSGGVLEDDMALWHCYQKNMKDKPKMIIIGIDPWLLNRHNEEIRWQKHLTDDYVAAAHELGFSRKVKANNEGYAQLVSKKYTQESWKKWRNKIQPLEVWTQAENSDEKRTLIYPDGSLEYGRSVYKVDSDDAARKYVEGKVYYIENYKGLDNEWQMEFIAFVQSLQQQGIKVVFYFPPYHPIVYEYLSQTEKYECVFLAEDWFRKFARKNNIDIIGSYNPVNMGLDGTAFFDGMHLKRYALKEFMRKCVGALVANK